MCSSSENINIFIISEDKQFSNRLRKIISNSLFKFAGVIYSPLFVISKTWKIEHIDIIILQIEEPLYKINEIISIIKKINRRAQLVYVQSSDNDDVTIPLRAGMQGCFSISDSDKFVIDTLIAVNENCFYYSSSVLARIVKYFFFTKDYNLTVKEKEVLALLVEGNTKKAIAEKIGRSFGTVDTHLKNIYRKLNVNSGIQAVALTVKERLI